MQYLRIEPHCWLLRLACCLLLLGNPCLLKAFALDSKMLQQKLSTETRVNSADKNDAADLLRFYKARNFQPVWFLYEKTSPLLETVLEFIENADKEGLDSRDYQLPKLLLLKEQVEYASSEALALELQTTQSILTLAKDLARGRLTANSADPDWHIPQPTFDAVDFLRKIFTEILDIKITW